MTNELIQRIVFYGTTLPIVVLFSLFLIFSAINSIKAHKRVVGTDMEFIYPKYEFIIPLSIMLVLIIGAISISIGFEYGIVDFKKP